ncbi:helix-turn-helix transcriptional regulator [Neolewinella agarilytica]|uniref:AraC-type DNA-binding protein n=1 Tax=Neolewinella agarilytica TaxID=478744 RepID=A0A1H9H5J7_9BACT|nr:helix-turn-helix transcriptional regulator [Neolewinella agarilytica]SEQ57596.1 AraC-type DNA-binding protein [Neolewinella agarilytica]
MQEQTLYIDDMVCYRCILVVEQLLKEAGWKILEIELGYVRAIPPTANISLQGLSDGLRKVGLRLRQDGHNLITQVKGIIIEYVYDDLATMDIPLSEIIVREVEMSYSYVSRHFSSSEQRTIEEFYQLHRIERAKRLLFQTNTNIKSVAQRLKYKSPGHFSASFRKLTGETPSDFRAKGNYKPQPIDKL